MRKLLWLLAALAMGLATGVASAQTGAINGFCEQGAQQASVSGLKSTNYQQGVVRSCTVTVYLSGTTTLATIYANPSSGALSNPFTASPTTGQWLFYAMQSGAYDVVLSGGITPNTYTSPVTLTGLLAGAGGSGGGGASITVNGGSALSSPVNFANSTGNGQINFANPSGSNVLATLATPFSVINGVNCPLGSTGCALPPFCAGPTCANLDQNNPTFATVLVTTTAAITPTSLTIPVASTTGWPSTGCGWTNGAVEFICWDSITPTSLVLNQLSLRRGGNAYTAVSHPINTNIEGAVYTQAAGPASPQNFQVSSAGQGGLLNGINPGVNFGTAFGSTVYMPFLLAAEGGVYMPNGFTFVSGGGGFVTSKSSATSQMVTCAPGTGIGDVCNDLGVWVTPGGGGISGLTPGVLPLAATSSTLGDSPIDNGNTNFGVLTSVLPLYVNPTDGNDQTTLVVSGEVTGQNSSIFDVDSFTGGQLLAVTGDGSPDPGAVQVFNGMVLGGEVAVTPVTPYICGDSHGLPTQDVVNCITYSLSGMDLSTNETSTGHPTITFSINDGAGGGTALISTVAFQGLELNYLTPSTSPLCYPTGSPAVVTNVGCTGGGGSITWPATGDLVISNSTSSPAGLAPVNGDCVFGSAGAWTAGSCGSGTFVTLSGDAISTSTGGATTVTGLLNNALPSLSAGFLNWTGTAWVFSAGGGGGCALGVCVQNNPPLGDSQFITTQPGDTTTFEQTSVGNIGVVQPNVISMFSYGQGWNCGNNSTSCGTPPAWSTQNALTIDAYSATRGIMQGLLINAGKNAGGDFAGLYMYCEASGGFVDASGEGSQCATFQFLQGPWFNGALVTPSVGTLSGAHGPSTSGLTYIWVGGNGAPVIFPAAGAVQSFSVTYTANTTAQTIDIGLATPNGLGSFTLGAPVTESLPSLTCSSGSPCVETWTPSLTAAAGQTIYYYQATGNAPANGSFAGAAFSGVPSAGTFSTSTASGLLMTATLAAPTNGANSITLGSLNCNVNCTNPRLASNIPDDDIVINTTAATSSVTLGAESSVMNGMSYALTAGTVPVSVAWGNIIGSSCTGNGSGHFQAYVATTCTVTLGVSPASPNHFVVSGGITSCPVVAASPGTSLDANLSGPFKEEVYITAVTTGSTTDSVTFCTRNAWNNGNSTRIMQGGPASEAFVSNAAVSAGWPVAYKIDGAFTSTQLAFSNCVGGGTGACNGVGSTGNILPSGTAVTIYSAAITTGTGNGATDTSTLGTNDMLLTVADNIVGAPTSEFSGEGIRMVCGQWTPIDGSNPSSCLQLSDSGGSRMLAMIRLGNSGSSGAPGFSMIDADTGFWFDALKLANAPTSYLIEMQNHSQTNNGIVKYDDSFGALSFIDTGSLFSQEVLNWTETFNAFAYEANGSLGTSGQCLTSGGTSTAAGWSNCITGIPWATPGTIGSTTPNSGAFTTLTATSLALGSSPPTCGAGVSGCGAFAEAGTAVTAAAGVDTIRADSSHLFKVDLNGGSEFTSLMNFSVVNLASSAPGGVTGNLPLAQVPGAAPLSSPTFTGTPTAPTATLGTNNNQIATTAFVAASTYLSGTTGSIGGSLLAGAGSCVTGTATVTGVGAGNFPIGSPVAVAASDGSLPNGLVTLSAAATGANTVTVSICAIAAVTPAAKNYSVAVF